MLRTSADGETVFLRLRRIQLAQVAFYTAFPLSVLFLVAWLWLLLRHPDYPSWTFVILIGISSVCVLVIAVAMAYLLTRRCPNCESAFSWNWMRGNVLKGDKSGRCTNCGIRLNVSNL